MAQNKRTWISESEWYADNRETGRYGGEVDYGCFWSTDEAHGAGRLSWIPESGEFYLYAKGETMLLGKIERHNREMAERVMSGWADACLRHEGIAWIVKSLDVHAQTYARLELAARAYARLHGITGVGGGWIYRAGKTHPLCQGWGALGTMLINRGHIRAGDQRYYIVDSRSMEARASEARKRVGLR